MKTRPTPNGANGRDGNGRFAPGNAGGPGNPYARETARLRRIIREAVSDDDLRAIIQKVVDAAKGGDIAAARELLTRIVGKPDGPSDPDAVDIAELRMKADRCNAAGCARYAAMLDSEPDL